MTRPPLIASVNLSREDGWRDEPHKFLYAFVKERVAEGYTHIQLGRPLHKDHPAWGKVWEPLNAHDYITHAQRLTLEHIVKQFPDITFSVHLGYEWIQPRPTLWFHYQRDPFVTGKRALTFDRYSRVAGEWGGAEYENAVELTWDWWRMRGYTIFSEGINVIGTGGIPYASDYAYTNHYGIEHNRPIATIPQMTRRGVITRDQPNPCMTKLDWFLRKIDNAPRRLKIDSPFYLAIDQQAYEGGYTMGEAFEYLINQPNVGILILNGGRRDQTKHGDLYAWGAAEFGGG